MPAPSTSAFGSTAAQPSGGLFGQRPATNAFGSVAPATNTFGQPQQTSAFGGGLGATGSAFGQPQAAGGINQGTAGPDFTPTQDRDITTGVNNFFQTITAMPQYKNYSLEELRLQDYAQGRKTAGAVGAGGAFGAAPATSAFGAAAPATSAFGQPAAGGAFGQPQQSAFGQPAAATGGAFGSTGGLFGQQQPAATSAFGQPAPAAGAFGATTSAFGQPAAATGGFGAGASTGAFGAAASKPFSFGKFSLYSLDKFEKNDWRLFFLLIGSTPAPAAGGFGAATGGFGQPAAATGAFGQPAAATGGFGGFGQKPAATGGFGATTGGFGQPAAATGGFGQAAGGFGAAASKPATSFSFGATAPAPAAGGFGGGFGQAAAPAAGGFGQAAGGGGLFGAAKPAAPTTSLFGNTTGATLGGATGGFGGFGAGQAQTGNQTSLFGQKPATGGLGGGLFGGNTLGGTTTATGGFGGFGQQQQGGQYQLPATGGLTSFGTNPLQQQQSLIATVDKNPYGNNPLFDMSKAPNNATKTGPSAVGLDGPSRKSSVHAYPIPPRVVSKIKLRGFSLSSGKPPQGTKKNISSSSLDGISDDAVLSAGAYAPRANNKNLVFDQNVDTANIVALVNDSKKAEKRRVVFNPNLELNATNKSSSGAKSNVDIGNGAETSTISKVTSTTTTTTTTTTVAPTLNSASASSVAIKNGYYISPTMETLSGMSKENLKHVHNLTIGRKGYGEIKFEVPIDLSEVVLDDIMGNIVVIEDKKIVVYPQEDSKPPQGSKLNMPALVRIDNCFSQDKNTGAAIKDPAHPRFQLFKEKLRKRGQVTFVNYEDNTGSWYFKVEGF